MPCVDDDDEDEDDGENEVALGQERDNDVTSSPIKRTANDVGAPDSCCTCRSATTTIDSQQ